MADDRHDAPTDPPAPTDAQEVAALRGLGLDALLGDSPSPTAWVEVESAARRANHRRTRLLSAVAVVVLVAGLVAGVLIARSGSEGTTADTVANAPGLWVLPPDGVTVEGTYAGENHGYVDADTDLDEVFVYAISYVDAAGNQLVLSVNQVPTSARRLSPGAGSLSSDATSPPPAAGERLLERLGFPPGWEAVTLADGRLGPQALTCLGSSMTADGTVGSDGSEPEVDARPVPAQPAGVVIDGGQGRIITLSSDPSVSGGAPCTPDLERDAVVMEAADALRRVDAETWRAFMEEHMPRPPSDTAAIAATTVPPAPSVSIPDEEAARSQISDVFTDLAARGDDGAFPSLEGGSDVAFYEPLFAEAAAKASGRGTARFTVVDVRFTSADDAEVMFRANAQLDSGPIEVVLPGRAIRVDGQWLVSRDTVVQMLGRADLVAR